DYPDQLRAALDLVDYDGWRARQRQVRAEGRRIGVGISAHVEGSGYGPYEGALVRVDASGHVTIHSGSNSHGQGHETTLGQVCADALGVPVGQVRVRHGDSSLLPFGGGTNASRSAVTAGSAVHLAATKVREKATAIAAHLLEVDPADMVLERGRLFPTGAPERALDLVEVARAAAPGNPLPGGMEPGLEAEAYFVPPTVTFSSGTHVAVVEVDEELGTVKILRYVVVDDCGRALNPMIVDGQQHGGVAHGIGNALLEEAVYDEQGQLLTASFMDYLIPTTMEVPPIQVEHREHPSPLNPLGVKGCGEGGTVSVPAAVTNAVADAMHPLRLRLTEVPLTPERLVRAIREARESGT
ncbi:MAG TPA: molybdopterin cofactor-binding domain-containing protein, partial [Longimicrobiales bacterium]|nr:molybdopterin cofactor-binding domain-containing protein [Longimicrobiales bacterium]